MYYHQKHTYGTNSYNFNITGSEWKTEYKIHFYIRKMIWLHKKTKVSWIKECKNTYPYGYSWHNKCVIQISRYICLNNHIFDKRWWWESHWRITQERFTLETKSKEIKLLYNINKLYWNYIMRLVKIFFTILKPCSCNFLQRLSTRILHINTSNYERKFVFYNNISCKTFKYNKILKIFSECRCWN